MNSIAKELKILAAEHNRGQQYFKGPRKIYLEILPYFSNEKTEVFANFGKRFLKSWQHCC
jgi:hypothetical protein